MNVIQECKNKCLFDRQPEEPDWLWLPDSILLKIFTYLNVSHIPDIAVVCRFVCCFFII